MSWTTTLPSRKGKYWVRARGVLSGRVYTTIVGVYASHRDGPVNTVFWDGENFPLTYDGFVAWGDSPIPSPDDA